jgi:TonB family protein
MNKIFLLSTLFIFASLNIAAQTPESSPKKIVGGVLNGKATSMPRPQYPAAARAVRASGAVSVQVLIDEQGNVASANAVSGHPLLRQAAEQAAREAKFLPTTLQGQPVKVSGIITYNFVTDMNFTQIGFDLSLLEKSKEVPKNIFAANIAANIPKEWEEERSNLYLLDAITREPVIIKPDSNTTGIGSSEEKTPLKIENYSSNSTTAMAQGTAKGEPVDRVKIAEELQKDIETRLASEKINLWKFQVGKALGRIAAQVEDEANVKTEASNLSDLISNAPSDFSSTLESLRKLVELIQTTDSTPERIADIKSTAMKLRNL